MITFATKAVQCQFCGGAVDQVGCSPSSPRLTCFTCRDVGMILGSSSRVGYCETCSSAFRLGQGRYQKRWCCTECENEAVRNHVWDCAKCGEKASGKILAGRVCVACRAKVRAGKAAEKRKKMERTCEDCLSTFVAAVVQGGSHTRCSKCRQDRRDREQQAARVEKAKQLRVGLTIDDREAHGTIGEMQFDFACVACRVPVFRPVLDKQAGIDRIIYVDGRLMSVQIKSGGEVARVWHDGRPDPALSSDLLAVVRYTDGVIWLMTWEQAYAIKGDRSQIWFHHIPSECLMDRTRMELLSGAGKI